jgi:hypothetical protein
MHRPWERATGPRTAAGKAQAVRNAKRRQIGPVSRRELQREIAAAFQTVAEMWHECDALVVDPNASEGTEARSGSNPATTQ